MMNDNATEIKKARREYYREWRKNNPDRVAQIQERYWLKKAAEARQNATERVETRSMEAIPGQQEQGRSDK